METPAEVAEAPAGCGFNGCMWGVMILFAVLLALMVFGLLTRIWMAPPLPG